MQMLACMNKAHRSTGAHAAHTAALDAGAKHQEALQDAYAEGLKRLAEIDAKKQAHLDEERARREAEERAKREKEKLKHATWKDGQGDVADSFIVSMQKELLARREQLQTQKSQRQLRRRKSHKNPPKKSK